MKPAKSSMMCISASGFSNLLHITGYTVRTTVYLLGVYLCNSVVMHQKKHPGISGNQCRRLKIWSQFECVQTQRILRKNMKHNMFSPWHIWNPSTTCRWLSPIVPPQLPHLQLQKKGFFFNAVATAVGYVLLGQNIFNINRK
jgi:hypothetical protein